MKIGQPMNTTDLAEKIIAFESGELDTKDVIYLFSDLIRTGQAWTLQGRYGRAAASFIEQGVISPDGDILIDLEYLDMENPYGD